MADCTIPSKAKMRPGRVVLVGLKHFEDERRVCRSVEHAKRWAALWEDEWDDEGYPRTYAAPLRIEDHDGKALTLLSL